MSILSIHTNLYQFLTIIVGSTKQEKGLSQSASFGATSDLAASLATFQQGFQMGPSQGIDDVSITITLILIRTLNLLLVLLLIVLLTPPLYALLCQN